MLSPEPKRLALSARRLMRGQSGIAVVSVLLTTISLAYCTSEEPRGTQQAESLPVVEVVSVREDGLVADLFFTPNAGPQRPIIFLGGSEGGLPFGSEKHIRDNPFLPAGYCVLSVAYFKEAGLPKTLTSVPLEFYDKAKAWLASHPAVHPDGVAIIGASKGGELALLLASRDPAVKCVVGINPGSYVFQGIAPRFHNNSSWSYQGKDLPFVPYKHNFTLFKAILTHKFHDVYRQALENTEAAEKARIQVESIKGAILLISGKKDRMWPSTEMCNGIVGELKESAFSYPYEHIAYDMGHAGMGRKQWKKVLQFLSEHYPNEAN